MPIGLMHPFADFFVRNDVLVSSDPLLPTSGRDAPFIDVASGGGGRGGHSPKAA